MNPIDELFARLRREGRGAMIPFLPAGDPDLAFMNDLLPAVVAAGADLIEIGFPFSDPIADGPVIQASYTRALKGNFKLDAAFETIGAITRQAGWNTPLVAMASYSLIYKRGLAAFVDRSLAAGLSGAVVPDLPVEEAEELAAICKSADFKLILLVTPTTDPARMRTIAATCTGFVYLVGVVGITGGRAALASTVATVAELLRNVTDLPLCVGFGISAPEHVRELKEHVDGVIVGSALVRELDGAGTLDGRTASIANISGKIRNLRAALE